MAVKYTYSITNDFPNNLVASSELASEIQISTITGTLSHINTDSDICDIWFDASLVSAEQITLSGVVSAHDGQYPSSEYKVTAGEDVGARKGIYISGSNEIKLARADSENTLPCVGFTESTAASGANAVIWTNDTLSGFSGLTPGAEYYLSDTAAGEITAIKPSSGSIISIGVAKTAAEIDIHIIRVPPASGIPNIVIQTRRNTAFNITTSYADVPLNLTDVEIDSTILEHDNVNTERINIKQDGTYTILYNLYTTVGTDVSSRVNIFTQVLKNGTTLIAGSDLNIGYYISQSTGQTENPTSNRSIITQLSSGDYLTLQTKYVEYLGPINSCDTQGDVIFTVTKLSEGQGPKGVDGPKGADGVDGSAGPSGSGSTINVYDGGSVVSGTPFEVLNLLGATISGSPTISGGVDITIPTPIFGSEYQVVESDGLSSITGTTALQEKLRLDVVDLPLGKYRISWNFDWLYSNTNNDFQASIEIDDGFTFIYSMTQEPQDASNEYNESGFNILTNYSGTHHFDLDYRTLNASYTAKILNARMEIWRIE